MKKIRRWILQTKFLHQSQESQELSLLLNSATKHGILLVCIEADNQRLYRPTANCPENDHEICYS